MNKNFFIIIFLFIIISCTLFETPIIEYSDFIKESSIYIDSMIIDSTGYYQIEYYSDYNMDVIFFDDYEGIELFTDSNELYSEMVFFPLMFTNTHYFLQDVFIYEKKTLYFIIDNSYNLTYPEDASNFTLKVFKKEE